METQWTGESKASAIITKVLLVAAIVFGATVIESLRDGNQFACSAPPDAIPVALALTIILINSLPITMITEEARVVR